MKSKPESDVNSQRLKMIIWLSSTPFKLQGEVLMKYFERALVWVRKMKMEIQREKCES